MHDKHTKKNEDYEMDGEGRDGGREKGKKKWNKICSVHEPISPQEMYTCALNMNHFFHFKIKSSKQDTRKVTIINPFHIVFFKVITQSAIYMQDILSEKY